MRALKDFFSSLGFKIIGALVTSLLLLALIAGIIGYAQYIRGIRTDYVNNEYSIAHGAASLVYSERIDEFLETGGTTEEYQLVEEEMSILCDETGLTLIYVIRPDTTDYKSFVNVLDVVSEYDTTYTRWGIGYVRETTNEEYENAYRRIYEAGSRYEVVFRREQLHGFPAHMTMIVPVVNHSGEITALLCTQRSLDELAGRYQTSLGMLLLSTLAIALLLSALVGWYLHKHFVNPIRAVQEEAERFSAENTPPKDRPGHGSRIREIASLADSVETMENRTVEYIENLTRITAEKERIDSELRIASSIQKNALPSGFPAFPDRTEFDLYAFMDPAREVSGDFYDYFLIDDDHLVILMADVSGKGISASLFMMRSKLLISEHARVGGTPSSILTDVNNRLCENNTANMFVTVWLGIVELSTGTLIGANAGHEEPAVCRSGGRFEIVENKRNLFLGARKNVRYRDFELSLHPGDKLFLYTDGIPEAVNVRGEMLRFDGMLDALNQAKDEPPQGICEAVKTGVEAFVGEAEQFDDITMLCFEYLGGGLRVEADYANYPRVRDYVASFVADWPAKTRKQIEVSVEEIFANVASYAYEDSGTVEIRAEPTEEGLSITVTDEGMAYDPLAKPDPDLRGTSKNRPIGGLGIFIAKNNMDAIDYRRADGKNILTMLKKRPPEASAEQPQ